MNEFDERARGSAQQAPQRIAVVTMGVKLPGETRGYTRFRKIAEMFCEAGFDVDLITTSFQHWEKAQRDTASKQYVGHPYSIVFIDEPGYSRNLDLKRIRSHAQAARNLSAHFAADPWRYDAIYCEIPPNDVARAAMDAAKVADIPFIADINDLWPEAMRAAYDIPIISDIAFRGFTRDAQAVYRGLTAAVGTSDEYALRPAADREDEYPHETVYVGNDIAEFDAGVAAYASEIEKPAEELWVTYAGTLGASYDIATLIKAAEANKTACPHVRIKVLGDGPDRQKLEQLATKLEAPVDFLGYLDYAHMAAYLSKSDMVVNSLVAGAAQSIVTKIGDYLASGCPIINTGESWEFKNKVTNQGFGVNVDPENVDALAAAIRRLARNLSLRKIMGSKGREIAENEFNQSQSYQQIVHLVQTLLV